MKSSDLSLLISEHHVLWNTLFTETNPSWSIYESIKSLEIKLFNLLFANNTTLSCILFFFLIIDLYFLIPDLFAQIFNPVAELAISIEIPTKEAKAEMKTHLVTAEAQISKC